MARTKNRRCSGSLYTLLGVPFTADRNEIKRAYHKLALELHPDKAGPARMEEFKAVQKAHAILIDEEQRKLYDSLGREQMERFNDMPGAAAFAVNPALVILYPAFWLLTVVCLLAFMAMLCKRVDQGWITGSWGGTVFVPLWILATALVLLALRVLLLLPTALRSEEPDRSAGRWRAVLGILLTNVVVALLVASAASVSQALDGNTTWEAAFIPILMLTALAVLAALATVPYCVFRRQFSIVHGVDPDVMTDEMRNSYIIHVVTQFISIACVVSFAGLLYHNVVGASAASVSYWVVFTPVFVRIGIPIVGALAVIYFAPTGTWTTKAFATVSIFVLASMLVVTAILLALKCENARRREGDSYPSLAVVFIPSFIVLSLSAVASIFMTCAAICHLREEGAFGGEDEDRFPNATEATNLSADAAPV